MSKPAYILPPTDMTKSAPHLMSSVVPGSVRQKSMSGEVGARRGGGLRPAAGPFGRPLSLRFLGHSNGFIDIGLGTRGDTAKKRFVRRIHRLDPLTGGALAQPGTDQHELITIRRRDGL